MRYMDQFEVGCFAVRAAHQVIAARAAELFTAVTWGFAAQVQCRCGVVLLAVARSEEEFVGLSTGVAE